MRVIVLHPYTKFDASRRSRSEDMVHGVKRPGNLDQYVGLSIFTFLRPSVLDLGSGTGKTDRQTDRQRPSMHYAPTLWGGGVIKVYFR